MWGRPATTAGGCSAMSKRYRRATLPITGMMTFVPEAPARPVDIVTLNDGRVLAIGESGIELWPSEAALLDADPSGDYIALEGFIEYTFGDDAFDNTRRSRLWESARWGRFARIGLVGEFIARYDDRTLHFRDGARLYLRPDRVVLYSEGDEATLGEIVLEDE